MKKIFSKFSAKILKGEKKFGVEMKIERKKSDCGFFKEKGISFGCYVLNTVREASVTKVLAKE